MLDIARNPCPPPTPAPLHGPFPALQAAAALYLGRRSRGVVPLWPSVLRTLTGFEDDSHSEVRARTERHQGVCF